MCTGRTTMAKLVITLSILVLFSSTYGQVEINITPAVSDLLVKDGTPQKLTCTTTSQGNMNWDYPMHKDVMFRRSNVFESGKYQRSTLEMANFSSLVEGKYECSVTDGQDTFSDTIRLIAVTETKTEPVYQYGNKSARLSCSISAGGNTVESITWSKDGKIVAKLDESERFVQDDTHALIINDPKREDVGIYTAQIKLEKIETPYSCEVNFKDAVLAITASKIEPTYYEGNETAVLSCNINVDKKEIERVEWFKNDTAVSDLDDAKKRFKVIKENNSLIIDKPDREDADLYIAKFYLAGEDTSFNCEVMYKASPLVLAFKKSKNLIEKDNLELQCEVLGYPRAEVTWYKDKKVLNVSQGGDDRLQLRPLKGYKNAKLIIKDVVFEDAGEYQCEAFSGFFNESFVRTVTVRVKDKLAALWPFLGIVFEVIVLCTIIFLYEKRRNKQAEQEERNAHEAEPSLEKKDGLRHRNTPGNPTA